MIANLLNAIIDDKGARVIFGFEIILTASSFDDMLTNSA